MSSKPDVQELLAKAKYLLQKPNKHKVQQKPGKTKKKQKGVGTQNTVVDGLGAHPEAASVHHHHKHDKEVTTNKPLFADLSFSSDCDSAGEIPSKTPELPVACSLSIENVALHNSLPRNKKMSLGTLCRSIQHSLNVVPDSESDEDKENVKPVEAVAVDSVSKQFSESDEEVQEIIKLEPRSPLSEVKLVSSPSKPVASKTPIRASGAEVKHKEDLSSTGAKPKTKKHKPHKKQIKKKSKHLSGKMLENIEFSSDSDSDQDISVALSHLAITNQSNLELSHISDSVGSNCSIISSSQQAEFQALNESLFHLLDTSLNKKKKSTRLKTKTKHKPKSGDGALDSSMQACGLQQSWRLSVIEPIPEESPGGIVIPGKKGSITNVENVPKGQKRALLSTSTPTRDAEKRLDVSEVVSPFGKVHEGFLKESNDSSMKNDSSHLLVCVQNESAQVSFASDTAGAFDAGEVSEQLTQHGKLPDTEPACGKAEILNSSFGARNKSSSSDSTNHCSFTSAKEIVEGSNPIKAEDIADILASFQNKKDSRKSVYFDALDFVQKSSAGLSPVSELPVGKNGRQRLEICKSPLQLEQEIDGYDATQISSQKQEGNNTKCTNSKQTEIRKSFYCDVNDISMQADFDSSTEESEPDIEKADVAHKTEKVETRQSFYCAVQDTSLQANFDSPSSEEEEEAVEMKPDPVPSKDTARVPVPDWLAKLKKKVTKRKSLYCEGMNTSVPGSANAAGLKVGSPCVKVRSAVKPISPIEETEMDHGTATPERDVSDEALCTGACSEKEKVEIRKSFYCQVEDTSLQANFDSSGSSVTEELPTPDSKPEVLEGHSSSIGKMLDSKKRTLKNALDGSSCTSDDFVLPTPCSKPETLENDSSTGDLLAVPDSQDLVTESGSSSIDLRPSPSSKTPDSFGCLTDSSITGDSFKVSVERCTPGEDSEDTSYQLGLPPTRRRRKLSSGSEEDLESFFVKMRTPAHKDESAETELEQVPSLDEFIVDDDDSYVSSYDSDDSDDEDAVFHIRTDPVLRTPMSERLKCHRQLDTPRFTPDEDSSSNVTLEENTTTHITPERDATTWKTPALPSASSKKMRALLLSDSESDEDDKENYYTPATHIKSKTRITPIRPNDDDAELFKTPALPFIKPKGTPRPKTSSNVLSELPRETSSGSARKKVNVDLPKQPCTFLESLSAKVPDSRRDREAARYVKEFKKLKADLASHLFKLFNKTVFDEKLPADLPILWNSRMTKTAGYCVYKKSPQQRSCRIELSVKVCDSAERTRDTLVHEMCHAAVWLLSGVNGGHGPHWKYWAKKGNHTHPELRPIKRCHSYEIQCKYIYKCTKCGYQLGRHSKSLDMKTKVCGYCKGDFELFTNSAKGLSKTPNTARTPNKFALFVQQNYGSTKKSNSDLKHKEIMKILSAEFAAKNKITSS